MGLPRQVNCISDQPCPLAPCWTYQAGPEDFQGDTRGRGYPDAATPSLLCFCVLPCGVTFRTWLTESSVLLPGDPVEVREAFNLFTFFFLLHDINGINKPSG